MVLFIFFLYLLLSCDFIGMGRRKVGFGANLLLGLMLTLTLLLVLFFFGGPWIQVRGWHISGADVAAWPYSVGILFSFFFLIPCIGLVLLTWAIWEFLFLELLILFEQWAGHRLLSEKVTRPHVRADRLILIPSVPVSEGIEIRHGCEFLSGLVRALAKLPGGLGRFLLCRIGSHMSRLRHLGWNQCSHGLTSRPLESCHHQCHKAVCGLLGYPKGSASELLDGTLKLRHCTALFTVRFLPWSLPRVGNGVVKGF